MYIFPETHSYWTIWKGLEPVSNYLYGLKNLNDNLFGSRPLSSWFIAVLISETNIESLGKLIVSFMTKFVISEI